MSGRLVEKLARVNLLIKTKFECFQTCAIIFSTRRVPFCIPSKLRGILESSRSVQFQVVASFKSAAYLNIVKRMDGIVIALVFGIKKDLQKIFLWFN